VSAVVTEGGDHVFFLQAATFCLRLCRRRKTLTAAKRRTRLQRPPIRCGSFTLQNTYKYRLWWIFGLDWVRFNVPLNTL